MGYNTQFELAWENKGVENKTPKIQEFLIANADTYYGVDEFGETTDSCKWYSYHDDMIVMSAQFPDVLFTLRGKGEESGDVWNNYYLGGKSQRAQAKLVFDEFDESKLR